MNTDSIKHWLKENLSNERYSHTLGTAQKAQELAILENLDPQKAYLAGLLHDCAKCMPNDELLKIIKEKIPSVDCEELKNYKTLHAPVSAYFAQTKFGVEDKNILSAIRWHTLGKVNMTPFDKIIFLADKIENKTRPLEYREEIENIYETQGLDAALLKCFENTIKSLVDRNLRICAATIDVYNWLLDLKNNTQD